MDNPNVILSLCSKLCKGNTSPYSSLEWSEFALRLLKAGLEPKDITLFSDDDFKTKLDIPRNEIDRIKQLLDRFGNLAFEITKLENMGIRIVTRADKKYPSLIKTRLDKLSPPLFYYIGNLELTADEYIGIIGSKLTTKEDDDFTKGIIENIVKKQKYSIITGGNKGIESFTSEYTLSIDGAVIEIACDSLINKLKDTTLNRAARDGNALIISESNPFYSPSAELAVAGSRYLYAIAKSVLIIKAELNMGFAWQAAINNLKNNYTETYCWFNEKHAGNMQLINSGAIPINKDDWDINNPKEKQITLFDLLKQE